MYGWGVGPGGTASIKQGLLHPCPIGLSFRTELDALLLSLLLLLPVPPLMLLPPLAPPLPLPQPLPLPLSHLPLPLRRLLLLHPRLRTSEDVRTQKWHPPG